MAQNTSAFNKVVNAIVVSCVPAANGVIVLIK